MRNSSIVLLFVWLFSSTSIADEKTAPDSWQAVAPQEVDNRYNRNFAYKHDGGFYFSLGIGPQWNQSLQNPAAGAFRFGGKFSLGWVVVPNLAVHANAWGNFLEQSSLIAAGPGVTYFFGDSNIALGAAVGVGLVFSTPASGLEAFRETVLAGEISLGKYWWVSENFSMGASLVSGVHGLTLSSASLSSVGWHAGLRFEILFN